MKIKIFLLLLLFIFVTPVFAEVRMVRPTIQARKEVREEVKERIAAKVRIILNRSTIRTIEGQTLTVENDGKTYTVLTGKFDTCTTQYRRKFWGTSGLDEMSVGDSVNVLGYWQDESQTNINACLVRDISVQRRFGVFFGEILSVSETGFVMSTVSEKRANQTVTLSANTTLINRREQKISLNDLQVGHKVRVHGLWNNQLNTITEVKKVKDFSLPTK